MKGLTEDKIQYKINTFNNCHNTLKFTTEEDKNNSTKQTQTNPNLGS